MSDETVFVRHHLPIILDVPEKLALKPVRSVEVLNLICTCLTEALEHDQRLQTLLKLYGVEWGWEKGTWDETPG